VAGPRGACTSAALVSPEFAAGLGNLSVNASGFRENHSESGIFPDAVTPQEAAKLLAANLKHPSQRFWADEISFVEAVEAFRERLVGHQQVSDAYLLGLAMQKRAS